MKSTKIFVKKKKTKDANRLMIDIEIFLKRKNLFASFTDCISQINNTQGDVARH